MLVAALVASCRIDADWDGTRYRCPDGVCPLGQTCVAGECVGEPGAPDGAPADGPAPTWDGAPDGPVGPGPDAPIGPEPDAAPPALCGRPDVFTDTFDDLHEMWGWSFENPNSPRAVTGGHGVVTLTGSTGYSGFGTSRWFDLTGGRVFVEVPVMANPATHAHAIVQVMSGGENRLVIVQENGTLYFDRWLAGVATTIASKPYDATADRWWQLREAGGTVYWETSQDGVSFVTRASAPTPGFAGTVRIELAAGTWQAETAPGEVHFDNLNGGGSPAGRWCKTASMSDDFEDGTPGMTWMRPYAGGGCTWAETGGGAVMTPSMTGGYCGYVSGTDYDLTDSSILVEVTEMVALTPSIGAYFKAETADDDAVEISQWGGTLSFVYWLNGSMKNVVASVTWDPVAHRWWRIREAGGTIYWDTSPDGMAWMNRASETVPFAVTAPHIVIGAGTNSPYSTPGQVRYDNYNRAP